MPVHDFTYPELLSVFKNPHIYIIRVLFCASVSIVQMYVLQETFVAELETPPIPPYAYAFMAITIFLEVSGTLALKGAIDDTRAYFPAYALYFSGYSMFAFTLRYIPLSVAYATWCAFGTVGVAVASCFLFGESLSASQWICIALMIPPMVGLHVA